LLTQHTARDTRSDHGPVRSQENQLLHLSIRRWHGRPFDLSCCFKKHRDSQPPGIVTFLPGINDGFGAEPEKPDAKIDEVLNNGGKLLAAFHKAAPEAVPRHRPHQSAELVSGRVHRQLYEQPLASGWRRIQHRLVRRRPQRRATAKWKVSTSSLPR